MEVATPPLAITDHPPQHEYVPASILGIQDPQSPFRSGSPLPETVPEEVIPPPITPLTVKKVIAIQMIIFPLILAVVFGLAWLALIASGMKYQDYIHIGKVKSAEPSVIFTDAAFVTIAPPVGPPGQVLESDGGQLKRVTPPFDLHMELSKKCWMEITTKQSDDGGEKLSGDYQANWSHTFKDLTSANIRTGCPGSVQFWVNGEPITPDNKAEHPEKVGLYSFPQ